MKRNKLNHRACWTMPYSILSGLTAIRLMLDTIDGGEVAEGSVPFRLPISDFRLLSNARTVAGLALVVMAACSTPTTEDYPDPVANPQSPLMLAGDWVPEDPHQINFDSLARIPSEHVIVSDVRDAGGTRVNQHNYLEYYNDRFWAMWSDGPGEPRVAPEEHRNRVPGHDRANQWVSFAYSKDGLNWSPIFNLTGMPEEGYGWIARGFWAREGKLLALASYYKAPGYRGEGLQLHAFELHQGDSIYWSHLGLVYDNTLNNFAPKKLPNGEWMMSRRDSVGDVYMMAGGAESFDQWESFPIVKRNDPGLGAEEPYWWVLPDNNLVGLFRDNQKSGFLFRAFSTDNGRSWTKPVRTNFPDATSKFNAVQLPDGRHVLVSNPKPGKRDPLALSISGDGLVFTKMGYLAGGRHVDYPHVIEHGGYLLVAFASAKQTVEVLKIKISDLDNL